MTEPIDQWPSPKNLIADHAHVHALGQIALVYNFLEDMFGFLFVICFPAERERAAIIFHKMNNRDRIDLLTDVLPYNEPNDQVIDRVQHAILCFDICTENRNIVMHAMNEFNQSSSPIIRLFKKHRNVPTKFAHYDVHLTDLRNMADEMAITFIYLVRLYAYLDSRQTQTPFDPPGALPDKFQKPRKLIPSEHPPTPETGEPQSPPSAE